MVSHHYNPDADEAVLAGASPDAQAFALPEGSQSVIEELSLRCHACKRNLRCWIACTAPAKHLAQLPISWSALRSDSRVFPWRPEFTPMRDFHALSLPLINLASVPPYSARQTEPE